ncbi:amidohydrolase 2 [Penicillium argentinense]|uniref:Amidohydrolase 2 n=1 Tax=Penicillium argentinense TaxID=1131581 RepID=A0A9W9EZF8_9EURO|nr:amidohydrolase 2 [Penicillium argentinense]KAJ5090783.1 amidohydrolase 2 [Penicillium argentinense]
MLGKIGLEDAYERAGLKEKHKHEASLYIAPEDRDRYIRQVHDINNDRLHLSNEHGIGYTVMSLTVPGIQGIADKSEAEKRVTSTNDWVTNEIKDKETVSPQYDTFWEVVTELYVPVYLHPAAPSDIILEKLYTQRHFLIGTPLSFANGVDPHRLRYICDGAFDRFSKLKLIIGHLGEHNPFDFWRINHWFEDVKKPIAEDEGRVMCKKSIHDYFKENIWVTTSGHVSTATLKYVVNEIGADRVLFSVDYSYDTIENECGWRDNVAKPIQKAVGRVDAYRRMGRDNAKKPLKLNSFHYSEALVS